MTTRELPAPAPASDSAPRAPWRPGWVASALVGIIGVALAVGVAELLAAFGQWIGLLNLPASPLTSLGQTFIQFTPEWLKELAIETFGENDKVALTGGMVLTLIIVAIGVGLVGRRSPRIAVAITVALVAVTAAAILSRTGSTVLDLLPILVGGAAGVVFLVVAFRRQVVSGPAADVRVSAEAPARAPAGRWPGVTMTDPADPGDPGDPLDSTDNPKARTTGSAHPMAAATAATAAAAPSAASVGSRNRARPTDQRGVDRRQFFRLAGIGALVAAAAGALARWIPSTADVAASRGRISLPTPTDGQTVDVVDVSLQVDGITPFVTDNADFYRVDTAFVVPRITAEDWELRIRGLVDQEISLRYDDLLAMDTIERMVTLTCVSNQVGGDLAGNARWQGVRIADVLAMAGPQTGAEGADCVLSTSVDGFTVTTPLEALTDGRDALLAFAMNGEALPVEHGFPVRMVVPGLYGYVSATKWVVELEVTRFADVSAYWTQRGWAPVAPIKTASRIDVPRSFAELGQGTVAVAGMAWAQHRGISAVQVQIDDGEWQEATLSGEVSIDTWRQWSYEWQATEPGIHSIRSRAVDGTGAVQTDQVQGVMPDGSTGLDIRQVSVTG